jgi:hypothetical protein
LVFTHARNSGCWSASALAAQRHRWRLHTCCPILFGAPLRHERLNLHRGTELTMHALAIPDSGRAMAQTRATTMEGLRCNARVGGAQAANAQSSLYPRIGRFVLGLLFTLVGQRSVPCSIAESILSQNSASCFRRFATIVRSSAVLSSF